MKRDLVPESKSALVKAKRIMESASNLHSRDSSAAFGMFCVPPDPAGFVPNHRLRKLIQLVDSAPPSPYLSRQVFLLLSKNVRLFSKPSRSEEDSVLHPMLCNLMRALKPNGEVGCQCSSGLQLQDKFASSGGFQLASANSTRPGPVLVWEAWVLIASEAKGTNASIFPALPQACQIAGDAALMLAAAGLNIEECAVPGILLTGDSVQFYGAFLLQGQFPCFALLSPPLSMTSRGMLRNRPMDRRIAPICP